MRVIFPLEAKAFRRSGIQRLGVMSLSSMLKNQGFTVELVRATFKDLTATLKSGEPALLAYSLVSQLAEPLLAVNKEIKRRFPAVQSFLGGPHPTYYPEVIEEEGVDGICLGEGEYAIVDLASKLRDEEDFTNLSNWHIKKNGETFKNELRSLIQDLDTLPFPDREIMPNDYMNSIMATRGCPYSCTYCLNAAYNKLYNNRSAKIRQRSVDNVIEELEQIKVRFPHTFVMFLDTILHVSKDWTEEFSRKYRKYIGMPFYCNVKTEIVDKETIKLLKTAGCYSVGIGIESSNEGIRKNLMNRKVTNDKIIEVTNLIHEAGIKIHSFNILGMPKTTFSDDVKTLQFNAHIKSDFAIASVLTPYKKTKIYDVVKSLNLLQANAQYHRGKFVFHTIDYGSELQGRKLINLESLFPFLVKYPFLMKHVNFLAKMPLTWLYFKLNTLWLLTVLKWQIFPPYWVRRLKGMLPSV